MLLIPPGWLGQVQPEEPALRRTEQAHAGWPARCCRAGASSEAGQEIRELGVLVDVCGRELQAGGACGTDHAQDVKGITARGEEIVRRSWWRAEQPRPRGCEQGSGRAQRSGLRELPGLFHARLSRDESQPCLVDLPGGMAGQAFEGLDFPRLQLGRQRGPQSGRQVLGARAVLGEQDQVQVAWLS